VRVSADTLLRFAGKVIRMTSTVCGIGILQLTMEVINGASVGFGHARNARARL
jgi:hypothetical protein